MQYRLTRTADNAMWVSDTKPFYASNAWQLSGNTIVGPEADFSFATIPGTGNPLLSPIQFMLRFTPQERVALRVLATTNAIVADWFSIVDDVRLTEVDLSLPATQQGVGYAISLIPDVVPADHATARVAEILAY